MSIAIMSALQDEIRVVLGRIDQPRSIEALQRSFYYGEIEGHQVVVVGSGVGKVRAAACAQFLIDQFSIDCLIVFGLAGALDNQLRIGDIVVSRRTIMHDYLVASQGVNEDIAIRAIEADPGLANLALAACRQVLTRTHARLGTVLTGDEAVADSRRKAALRRRYGGDCVEMEGAAAALVCSLNAVPFVIVRSISDFADKRAHQQFEASFTQVIHQPTQVVLQMLRMISTADGDGVFGRRIADALAGC